jgi:glutamine phosphoribosylpyrophosphate amidotransferase
LACNPHSHQPCISGHQPAIVLFLSDAMIAVPQVYLASSAPPVRFPNVYGVDMPNRKEFVAHGLTEEQVGDCYNNCY